MKESNVPKNIFFEKQILVLPTLIKLGIDDRLYHSTHLDTELKMGQWIERGDNIMKISITKFKNKNKPSLFWQSDKIINESFELKSPTAGLVISVMRNDGVIGWKLPIILIPRNEPPIHNHYVNDFYKDVLFAIYRDWKIMLKNDRNKNKIFRVGEFFENENIPIPETPLEMPQIIFEFPDGHWEGALVSNIHNLRSEFLDLRDKLFHLVEDYT